MLLYKAIEYIVDKPHIVTLSDLLFHFELNWRDYFSYSSVTRELLELQKDVQEVLEKLFEGKNLKEVTISEIVDLLN